MLQNLANETILSLVNVLNGNKESKEIIAQALKLICNGFSFDCGLIYEIDFTNHICLTQQYELDSNTAHTPDIVELFTSQDQMNFIKKNMAFMERGGSNTPFELQLLDRCQAESLVMIPIMYENQSTFGYVIFLNRTHKNELCELDLNLMSNALSLLIRYIEVSVYQKKLGQIQIALESVLDHAGVDIYVNDFYNHDILYTNESMAAPYGGKEQFMGKKCWQALFPGQKGICEFCPQKQLIDENGMPTKVYSWDYQRSFDGSWFRVFSAAFHWVDGRLAHIVSSADISENKRNEALIENLANYDQLTQLPNRRSLIKECERRIIHAKDKNCGYLLFFDIDGFKSINDNYGHDAGDEFLIQLGAFFSNIPLLKNAIYRNGGDEFVAIIDGNSITKDGVKQLADLIHERFKQVWKLKYGEVRCNTSIGVACYPEDGATPQELLQKADEAMYRVKKLGGGGLCFGETNETK